MSTRSHDRRIDRILAADYLDGLEERPLAEVRIMRTDAHEEESLFSYERRLLHGRLAILRAELERRAGGGAGSLVDALPSILADERRTTRGAFAGFGDVQIPYDHPSRRVTKLVSDDTLTRLPDLSDEEIRSHITGLEEAEREVSETRSKVIAVLDRLNHEIGRRYQTGETDPGDVLGD